MKLIVDCEYIGNREYIFYADEEMYTNFKVKYIFGNIHYIVYEYLYK